LLIIVENIMYHYKLKIVTFLIILNNRNVIKSI
jgi:hypothetical protein